MGSNPRVIFVVRQKIYNKEGLNPMELKDEGICRFCLKTFGGRSMARHLTSCKVKEQQDNEDSTNGKKISSIYQIKIYSYKPYWLHLEAKSTATLFDLDKFLRDIWLECCGHLSKFTINGIEYSVFDDEDEWWDRKSKSMDVELRKVLSVKDRFEYKYDFGSTTYLQGEVYAERKGILKDKIRILARNNPPKFECVDCNAKATKICIKCNEFYCDQCLTKHECRDEMSLPIVNSPRMGVCGYYGENDFDNFSIQL